MSPDTVQRILVIGPSNIGDAVLAGEVIARLHERFPAAHLTLVVGARAAALFQDDPRVRTLVDADAFSGWAGRVKLGLALWRFHPQIVVDLRHTALPLFLTPLTAWRYVLPPPRRIVHMRDRHLWKLRIQVAEWPSGRVIEDLFQCSLWFSEKDKAHIDSLCKRWSINGTMPLVIICPGARSHIKRWTAEGFAQVADRLMAEQRAAVILSGEPAEQSIVDEVLAAMKHKAHNAVGLTTARQAALLMQRARVVITNDSASLHLASAINAPTVAMFGPTDERKYGPTASQRRTVRRRLFCTPCEAALCRFHHECMRFISPDEVYEAARDLLANG
ncbi:MAG: glycosyltransferase family 9 protein [Candidatus Omnitrophica bacterium]|nr:glycosyltransferase family 9 protein [Candidatus Omnitrophota bacterium]